MDEFYPGINLWKADQVRPALKPLRKLAEEKNLSVVFISHVNKGEGSAKQRAMISSSIMNTCRAAWLFVEDPEEPERYLVLRAKSNGRSVPRLRGSLFRLKT